MEYTTQWKDSSEFAQAIGQQIYLPIRKIGGIRETKIDLPKPQIIKENLHFKTK